MNTGRSLRSLSSDDLYDVAYRLLMERTRTTEEEMIAQEKTRSRIYDLIYEGETGMPALTMLYKPADEM